MEKLNVNDLLHFSPKQQEALEATKTHKYVLYGGSMGSGKSHWLRWTSIYWLLKLYAELGQEGIRVGLFCEDYPSLNDRHITKIRTEFPDWLGTYYETRHEFVLHKEYGSGVLALRNLDDASRYMSVEFATIAVDELPKNPLSTFNMLRTRLRWPNLKHGRFFAACNPVGEIWVKRYFVDRIYPSTETEQDQFKFVPALMTDNPYLSSEYYTQLGSLPELERRAFLEGDWSAFERETDEWGYQNLLTDKEIQTSQLERVNHFGHRILGVDPAGGGDETVIVMKSDIAQEIVFKQKTRDTMTIIPEVVRIMKSEPIMKVVVDVGGIGKGIYDRLRELRIPVIACNFGAKTTRKDLYENLKAELYWRQREWILKSGGRMKRHDGWNEFNIVKYKVSDGRIRIQSKEDLLAKGIPSPNVVDAAVLTQFVSPAQLQYEDIKRTIPFRDNVAEVWKS